MARFRREEDEAEMRNYTMHGESHTRLYYCWQHAIQRCTNPNNKNYDLYGARGITISDEWRNYLPFKKWAEANGYDDNLTLDRVDGNKGYYPDNCRWITQAEQTRNRDNNIYATYNGETKLLKEWSAVFNIGYDTLRSRYLRYHWSIEKSLLTPIRIRR